ncbi:MAG TPA: trehalose-phosphatase [Candidatus Binataceae bacterium]|nr:trehalose-phosphatase [Candidatus Binataceae bacterium]
MIRKLLGSELIPSPLPENLLPNLVQRKPILLCLDYDGTISEIARDPRLARPVSGVVEVLRVLAAHRGRVATALISGRSIRDLRSMLPLGPGVAVAGVHGLQLLDADGKVEVPREIRECREDLENVRLWLEKNLPVNCGFVVENKGVALALHYRQAPEPIANYVRDSFEQFIQECATSLRAGHGKMVIEALPKFASKATALRILWQRAGDDFEPVYFGDDLTDEDAFRELANRGVSVLVGEPRRTAAHYRVDTPADVVHMLDLLAAALET